MDHSIVLGGAQLSLVSHLRELDHTRFEAHVACGDGVPLLVSLYRDAGATVHPLEMPRLRRLDPLVPVRLARTALAVRRLVRRLDAGLVVTSTSRAAYLAVPALAGLGVPLVWWTRDFQYNRFAFRLGQRRVDRFFCISEEIRRYYGGEGDPRYAIVHVGTRMDEALDALPPGAVAAERARWGFTDAHVVVGSMGRIVDEKGPEDLVSAVAALHARDPRLRLLIAGSGEGQPGNVEPQLRALVRERGWSFVTFAGFQRDEALYHSVPDISVLASRVPDGYPTTVLQAMMAGRAVVATDTGGTRELVEHGVTGLLVPPSNPERLAAAIETLANDPALRARLGAAARAQVLRNNLESHLTRVAEAHYLELVGGA